MAMLGNVEDLINQAPARSRLMRGLVLLKDYLEGRAPEIAKAVSKLRVGESARVALEGDSLYVLIQSYEPKEFAKAKFEAHEHHTDLQYICEGREWIAVCDLRRRGVPPAYDQNGNIFFPPNEHPCTRLLLECGDIAVLFPNDAHAACLRVDGREEQVVCKIVVKIKDAHLLEIPAHIHQSCELGGCGQ